MLVKHIYVHVVYNCSVSNGVKSCLNIDNAKLAEFWCGGWLKTAVVAVSSFFSALFFTIRNLSVPQIFLCPGSITCGSGIGCSVWALSTLQGNQGSTDLATSPAAAEGTEFAPKCTDYCQCEQHHVACFTPAENLTQRKKKKNKKIKCDKI